jgi:hypothetical protein
VGPSRLGIAGLVVLASSAVAHIACAEPARLDWTAPPACGGESTLRAELARLLGDAALDNGGFAATARVALDANGRYTLELSVQTAAGAGTRTLSAETCESLVQVAAFSIALAVNPELAAAPAETSAPAPQPEVAPASAPPTPAPPAAARAQPSSDSAAVQRPPPPSHDSSRGASPELWLSAHVVGDSSLLPSPAVGFGGGIETVVGQFRFGLTAQGFIPQEELLESGTGGFFTLWSIEGHACYDFRLPLRLSVCPLVQGGLLHGTGRGVADAIEQQSSLVALGGAVAFRFPVSESANVALGAAAVFPLMSDYFVVAAGKVHEIPVISFQGTLSVDLRAF